MKIFFDHQAFSLHNHGGVSRYFCELIDGINQTTNDGAYLPLLFSNNIHLQEKGFVTKPFLSNYQFNRKVRVLYQLNKYYTLPLLKKTDYDILHPTYFDSYFMPYRKRKPLVVTFHDMIHEKFAHQFEELTRDRGIIERKRQLAQQADRIIAVSESTKQDIVDLLNINPEKIDVVYHGSSFSEEPDSSANESVTASQPYLLYVGSRKVYKNFDGFLKIIHPILKQHKLKLICAGGGSFSGEERAQIQSLGIGHLVEQQNIDDQILRRLYQQAVAFVYPSLYEGFGIPILEAFDSNCPCIISRCSSFPEVAGDAALYVDFSDFDSVADAVERVLHDTFLRADIVRQGRERLAKFSWKTTVEKTLDVYHSLV